jgi:hypothetical protein
MSALPRKRSALGDSRIFLDAFVIGDQLEGKAKDHSDVVYNQNDNPAVPERGQSSPDGWVRQITARAPRQACRAAGEPAKGV